MTSIANPLDLLNAYVAAVKDVEEKRKALTTSTTYLERIRADFKKTFPGVFNDLIQYVDRD